MNRPQSRYNDLERIQFVAAHYNDLPGLRALPVAVALLWLPLVTGSLVTGTAHSVVMWSAPFLLVAATALGVWAHRHYRERFGGVESVPTPPWRRAGVILAGAGVLAAALFMQWSGWEESLPFSPAWTILWAAILASALRFFRFVPHYAALAALGLGAAAAPLGWLPGLDAHPYSADKWGLFVMGLLLLGLAHMDHRFLSRVLSPLAEEESEESAVENGAFSR